ncbi:MAG: class I adenylate-forming enzyme family protein [Promethearchaeota archaeon]
MKDYSNWEIDFDFENESPYLTNPNRLWLRNRPPEQPKSIIYDPIPVHEFIKTNAKKYPNNVCVYHKPTDKKYTYRELIYFSDKVGNALHDMGIKKGDSVAIMSENCPEFLFSSIGIMETGASLVPINPLLKKTEVSHIIRESGNIKVIFVHINNFRTIRRVKKEVDLNNIILLGSEEAKANTITYDELIRDAPSKPPDDYIDPVNDIAALMFTGGTTGLPKGVMITHDNLIHGLLSLIYVIPTSEGKPIKAFFGKRASLSVLPLCHAMGFVLMIWGLYIGGMLVMFPFNPTDVLDAIEYYKVKRFSFVPVMYQMIINSPDFTERDLSSLENVGSASAPLSPELNRQWENVVGIKVGQGYGLTECSGGAITTTNWIPEVKPESIGFPIIDTDAIIVNPDKIKDGLEELPIGEVGELMIKGPQIMKGYWKRPDETKRDIIDGWLRTGDLARMDNDGYFYIEGRTKDMIKYKGYKVMPQEVEEKLVEHPAILEVGVIGMPDPNIGETIKAFIVLKPEFKEKITEQDIIEWAKERLAGYKYPRIIEFLDVLPRTAVGKIFRRKLRESLIIPIY